MKPRDQRFLVFSVYSCHRRIPNPRPFPTTATLSNAFLHHQEGLRCQFTKCTYYRSDRTVLGAALQRRTRITVTLHQLPDPTKDVSGAGVFSSLDRSASPLPRFARRGDDKGLRMGWGLRFAGCLDFARHERGGVCPAAGRGPDDRAGQFWAPAYAGEQLHAPHGQSLAPCAGEQLHAPHGNSPPPPNFPDPTPFPTDGRF
jgi:hypothetical protein